MRKIIQLYVNLANSIFVRDSYTSFSILAYLDDLDVTWWELSQNDYKKISIFLIELEVKNSSWYVLRLFAKLKVRHEMSWVSRLDIAFTNKQFWKINWSQLPAGWLSIYWSSLSRYRLFCRISLLCGVAPDFIGRLSSCIGARVLPLMRLICSLSDW